jgi:hypothetical protein
MLPCLMEAVPAGTVADLHRTLGLRAFGDRDPDGASREFAAARLVEPGYRLGPLIAPPGHPITDAYVALDLKDQSWAAFAESPTGTILVNGTSSRRRPRDLPVLLQVVNYDGHIEHSLYLRPTDAVPVWLVEAPDWVGKGNAHRLRRATLQAAAATAAASGVLYVLAARTEARYLDDGTPYAQLESLRARANTLTLASGTAGAVAVVAGTGAYLVFRW